MNNDELKNKIVEIIISAIWKDAEADYDSTDKTEAYSIADALIAAGIGDVKEAEHREKVLGRTLAIMKGKGLISGVVDDYIVQAEKELAEEGKE